jgi:hypothetical protein
LWRWVSKWLWTCFNGISTDGRYYHAEMNSKIFEKWVNEQLEPALPKKSLIIMDNASYQCQRGRNKSPNFKLTKRWHDEFVDKKTI